MKINTIFIVEWLFFPLYPDPNNRHRHIIKGKDATTKLSNKTYHPSCRHSLRIAMDPIYLFQASFKVSLL